MMNMINTIVTLVTIILLLVLLVVTVVVGTIWPRVFSRSVRGVCTPVIRPGVFQTKIIIKIEDSNYPLLTDGKAFANRKKEKKESKITFALILKLGTD